jgi:starch synthase
MAIDCPPLYERGGGPYQDENGEDWPDNALRFGVLSQVAARLGGPASPLDWHPGVVHCHDWQAALAPAYLRYMPGPRAASVVTVHNLAFHGSFPPERVGELGLPPESYAIEGLEFYGQMSFLKAGLIWADAITTVSPTYAKEIQSEEQGGGMAGVLRMRSRDLTGIVNGIDTSVWDPAGDALIARRYGPGSLGHKRANKTALQHRLGLAAQPAAPLLGIVSRFTHQKGIDLVPAAMEAFAGTEIQLAALGCGERAQEAALRSLAARQPGRIAVSLGFDESLAHLIEAGADAFLMPSRFEPCGLNQMYSQRYGTPPIARATGGLADTIVDCTAASLDAGRATGFLFDDASVPALSTAIRRALEVYDSTPEWRALQKNGMARDFSWKYSAARYVEIYRRVAGKEEVTEKA